jgi:hypothetical protein
VSSSVFSEFVFWLAAAVCVVAQVAVVRAAVAGRTPGASSSMATRVREFFWVVLPAAILVLVLVWTWRSLPSRAGNAVMDSQAIGTLAPGSGMVVA